MEYFFTGFRQFDSVRQYAFEGNADERPRRKYTVAIDVGLVRKYSIPLQEVPLLCRRFLEESEVSDERRAFLFSEEDMRRHRAAQVALIEATAARRKHHTVPARNNKTGEAWRGVRL